MLALRGRPHYNTDWIVERLNGADPIARLILVASKMSQLFLATTSLQPLAPASEPTTTPFNTNTSTNTDNIPQFAHLLLIGRQIDLELISWSQNLPDRWLPIVIYPDKSSSKTNTNANDHEPLITYRHLSIASVWTYYRAVRIVSHLIMLELQRAIAAAAGTDASSDETPTAAQTIPAIIQKQITDICRSIPFCLGDVDVNGNRTTSPSAGSASASEGNSKPQPRARAFSVYSMIWPLWYILSCGRATPAQEDHIRNCLARIGSVLGIKLALVLAEDAESYRRPPISLEGVVLGGQGPEPGR
ncbi:hypothetical protein BDW66DRAFT_129796 [Aspergillus desertorum]